MSQPPAVTPPEVCDLRGFVAALGRIDLRVSDPALIDDLHELELLKRAVVATQLRVVSAFFDSRQAANTAAKQARVDTAADLPAANPAALAGQEVGLAKRESPYWGGVFLGVAHAVVHEMPCTLAGLATGLISEHVVTDLVKETATLTAENRGRVDAKIAEHFDTGESDRALAALARRYAEEAEPGHSMRRRTRAVTQRRVSLRPAPDGMTYFTGHLPLQDGVSAYAVLERAAKAAKAAGDERSVGQIMADTLTEWITGRRAAHHLTLTNADTYLGDDEISPCRCQHTTDAFGRPVRDIATDAGADPADAGADTVGPSGDSATSDAHPGASTGSPADATGHGTTDAGAGAGADAESGAVHDGTQPVGADNEPSVQNPDRQTAPGRARPPRYKPGDLIPGYGPQPENPTRTTEHSRSRCGPDAGHECACSGGEAGHESALSGSDAGRESAHGEGARRDSVASPEHPGPLAPPAVLNPDGAAGAATAPQHECTCRDADGSPTQRPPIDLVLVMTPDALAGDSEQPGSLNGHPIPAWAARAMAADPDAAVWVRRLYQHPTTGQVVAMDSRSRFFTGRLRDLIIARDGECRTPHCGAPINALDHVLRHADGGPTSYNAAAGHCARCNYIKEHPGYDVTTISHTCDEATTPAADNTDTSTSSGAGTRAAECDSAAATGSAAPASRPAPPDAEAPAADQSGGATSVGTTDGKAVGRTRKARTRASSELADLNQPPPPDLEFTTPTGHRYTSSAPAVLPDLGAGVHGLPSGEVGEANSSKAD